jgi:aminopeptidase-like protein
VTYKQSRQGSAEIDRAVGQVLKDSGEPYHIEGFVPYGYDERQYCSQGLDLPVGCLMRTPSGQFPEYHTSADNIEFVRPSALADSLIKCLSIMYILEHNRRYQNLNPKCEPRLGPRGLYRTSGGHSGTTTIGELPVLWVLNWSDGQHSLLDIAKKSGLPFSAIKQAADALEACKLLQECISV